MRLKLASTHPFNWASQKQQRGDKKPNPPKLPAQEITRPSLLPVGRASGSRARRDASRLGRVRARAGFGGIWWRGWCTCCCRESAPKEVSDQHCACTSS